MSNDTEQVDIFFNQIAENESSFTSALNNYTLCYVNFNISEPTSDFKCSSVKQGETCNDCMNTSEAIVLQSIAEIQNIDKQILKETKNQMALLSDNKPIGPTTEELSKEKNNVSNLINRYNTSNESLNNSVELYKIYRIQLITEVIKSLILIIIIFYTLSHTTGVQFITFLALISYMTLMTLELFYPNNILFAITIIILLFFVLCMIMNVNNIRVNYQSVKNQTIGTVNKISNEITKNTSIVKL